MLRNKLEIKIWIQSTYLPLLPNKKHGNSGKLINESLHLNKKKKKNKKKKEKKEEVMRLSSKEIQTSEPRYLRKSMKRSLQL